MKTLADVMTQALDYLAYHFPTIAFEVDTRSHALRLTAPGQPQQSVIITFDGIFPSYFYGGKDHATLVNLALAIANTTLQSIRFGQSVCDDVQPLTPPLIDYPFRTKRMIGTRSETHLIFHPAIQISMIHQFNLRDCSRAVRYSAQHQLNQEVLTHLQQRLTSLRLQMKNPGKTHQLPDTYATAPGVQP